MPHDDGVERRFLSLTESRMDVSETEQIEGYPIVFHARSVDLGGFQEVILPAAVDRTLREQLDVRALVDHDPAKIMGRLGAGTLRIFKHEQGLWMRNDPPNTSYAKDIRESIRRKDVTGMSFAFRVLTETRDGVQGDEWDFSGDLPIRYVHDMRIGEVSVVTFPAYPTSSVEMAQRSLQTAQARWTPSRAFRERWLKASVG